MKKLIGLLVSVVTLLSLVLVVNGASVADCKKDSGCPAAFYTDLNLSGWYHDGIHFCVEEGMMIGEGNKFEPDTEATREEIVYAIWVAAGKPAAEREVTFTDVDKSSKYAPAISWAASIYVVTGHGDGTFAPKDNVTREQLATMLYRFAKTKPSYIPAYGFSLNFSDNNKVSTWARDSLTWCVRKGIMNGVGGGKLDPQGTALRSHVAAMLQRYCQQILMNESICVRYSDFGAVGDGVTDDFSAIVMAHNYANTHGLPVYADDGATYYIGEARGTAAIRTNTTWTGATFIIDDRNLVPFRSSINTLFSVTGDQYVNIPEITSLKKWQKHLGFAPGEDLLVTVENNKITHYIRSGRNANSGTPMSDTFIVDAEGNILTDIVWNFDNISSCWAKKLAEPLVIEGGTFHIMVSRHQSHSYFSRNIKVSRSNTTIRNLTMEIIDEGDTGSPYAGFITVTNAANVKLENLMLDAFNPFNGGYGTYAMQLNYCVNITLDNVVQGNDIHDTDRWGIMCTNFCKDFYLKNCRLNRYDSHMGVANCTIENSTIGGSGVNIIGHGKFVLRNSTVYQDNLVILRSDYGSTWDGDVYIENVEWYPESRAPSIIRVENNGIHDYGYTCYMPHNVYIDGLRIVDTENKDPEYNGPRILSYYSLARKHGTISPYILCERVVAKNVYTDSGKPVYLSFFEKDYPNVKWEISDSGIVEEFLPIPEQEAWLEQEGYMESDP